ncbi:hypothetical protein MIMGU_mgv1a019452mg [Erythranthe guttata]|uniref:Uncharacterized protein n=1 Tax=Erythranthe guttata TaxID=4155 RepID=A0A022R5G2_ERYGU|nr:hypothetical protein MIMGU_mgv1a019452mg [Erythranthe guttata]
MELSNMKWSKFFLPFSVFWLRSSVVSVLISLISDMWANGSHDIKFIFVGGGPHGQLAALGLHASPVRCTTVWAWRTPPILV